MPEQKRKRRALAAAVDTCTRRDSDVSEAEASEVDSDASEDACLEGEDGLLDRQQSESEPAAGPARGAQASRTGRGRARGRGATTTAATGRRRYDSQDPDITPTQPTFRPLRSPGSQLVTTADYSVLDLFQVFFTKTVLQTIVKNTNEHGRARYNKPSDPWTDVTLLDMLSFLSVVVYMSFVRAPALTDYWRTSSLYSFGFTKNTITGKKFLTISRALHLSSAADDEANERKRGTREFDRLGKMKPLYTQIRDACRTNYHPDQHISVHERMVASKARIILKQNIKNKPARGGFKLFVLADSKTGYTWDFMYGGTSTESTGKGPSCDSVMDLVNPSVLGTGYKLNVDHFYTRPTPLRDLSQQRIWACGTGRTNTAGYPKTKMNTLDSESSRGSVRWLREDPLLSVRRRNTRDLTLRSTSHTAHGTQAAKRKMIDREGRWTSENVPIPPAVHDYDPHMGGDLSHQLIGYHDVLHKTTKWYKTLFFHFVDVTVVNAFILHKAQCTAKGRVPMHQKAFRETLAVELSRVGSQPGTPQQEQERAPEPPDPHHRLVFIAPDSGDRTSGRLKCRKCHAKTPVKCATCNMPLCFVVTRDCYNDWHRENMWTQ